MSYNLTQEQIQELKTQYYKNRSHRFVNRIRVVLALARGYTVSDLALIFMLDSDTICRYFRLYKEGGINGLWEIHCNGCPSSLTEEQKE
ncbi:MAG: helix-turn-helix domain containing protein [Planctomycetaceae bacterium]|nr:helix-turn-helix domain containing protein [Planctomycetaceae bacterium]